MMTTGTPTHEPAAVALPKDENKSNHGMKTLDDEEEAPMVVTATQPQPSSTSMSMAEELLEDEDDSDADSLLPPPGEEEEETKNADIQSFPSGTEDDIFVEESHPEDEKIVMVVDYVEPVDSGAGGGGGNVDDSVDDLPEMEAPVAPATGESDQANESQPTEEAEPVVYKNKVERRIGEVMQNRDWSLETKRSPDLVPLTKEYQVYRKELAKLVKTTKDYLWANEKCNLMRAKMMAQCVSMSKDTPLYIHVGKPSGDAEDQADADQDDETHDIEALLEAGGALSLHSIEKLTSFYSKTSNEEFDKYVLTYAMEWERVITSRLDQEIASVAYLQKRKVHYERKVDALRKKVMKIEKKPNKEVDPKLQEKLDRNEEKLSDSWKTHETQSAKLAVLLEESVRNGFRDLYTFLKNYSRFEINKATRTEVLKMKLKLNLLAMKAEHFDADAEQPQQPSETFRVV